MTILSKKKNNQGKPEENSDASAHHGGSHSHSLNLSSIPNHSQAQETLSHERLNSSPCWSSRDEKRSSLCTSSHFDDSHESGPSHSKRRHRTSPHRTNRCKHRERNSASASPTYSASSSVVNSSPEAGPSRVGDDPDNANGYNSDDEYGPVSDRLSESEWIERDRWFEKNIRRKGFVIKKMEEDGACLFRAVADQVYGDQEMHNVVRNHCMDYIAANGDYFSHYVTEDFDRYVNRKRRDYVHGNHIEMQAMSEMYNRTVEVFCYGVEPINIFHGKHKTENEPIRLSYQRGRHYNSIVDPFKATIGVGLGLPSYTPGLADKNLMKEAVSLSEDFQIEQTMLEDKLRATDWEATNEAIEEQVARESYLQWLRDNEKRNSSVRSASETSSSATVTSAELRSSPRSRSGLSSPAKTESQHGSPKYNEAVNHKEDASELAKDAGKKGSNDNQCQPFNLLETASFINRLSPEMFGLTDWEDAGILAQVLATSQQEYMDRLKKVRNEEKETWENELDRPSTSRSSAISTNSLPNGIQPADVQQAQQEMNNLLTPEEVLKRYREAIIHYSKYQNAGIIETEASFKAARIAVEQSCTLQAASFLQNVIFINLPLSEQEKIQRFTSLSDLYCQIGFLRKASFCRRLAATRHVSTQNPQPNWAHCYQLMLQALRGHRLSLDPAELPADGVQGWPVLQVQLLQELVVAAKRAGLPALATRHMTFLLQSMWGHLSLVERRDLAMQLQALAAQCEGAPVPLVLDSGQVVPPANLTSVPSVRSFSLQNLPAPLRPQKLETQQEDSGPFLFTPIHFGSLERRSGASSKMDYQWVVGDTCEVSLELSNPLPFELKVSNMRLLTSGAVFESLPTSLVLPPDSGPHPAKLCGIPKEVGELEVLGFSTHTLGVKSNIRLKHLPGFPHPQLQVDVVPALPQLTVTVSPPAGTLAPSSASPSCLGTTAHVVSSLSLALYAGQSVEVGIQLRSTGTEPVQLLEAAVSSPLDSQLQAQVFQFSAENLQTQLPLAPGSAASLTLYLHSASEFLAPGLMDAELGSLPASSLPMSSQPASFLSGPSSLPSRLSSPALPARRHDLTASFRSQSSSRSGSSLGSSRFPGSKVSSPNTPKVLEGQLKLRYSGGPGLTAGHCRMCSVSITLEMLPSILITGWDVLPAETSSQFYLVLDAANASSVEMELQYAPGKSVLMEGGESCRVPVPVPRCPLAKLAKLYEGEHLQTEERRALDQVCAEHVVNHVDLRWRMPSQSLQGRVSLKGLSLTPDMLDVVRMSPLQWDVTVDGQPVKPQPQEELSAVAGQLLTLGVNVTNTLERPLSRLALALQFYQDHQNGAMNYRLDTRLASAGATKVILPKLAEQGTAYHECSVVFFTPGQYKADIQCTTQLEGEDGDGSHVWKFTPAVCISVLDAHPN